MLHMPCVARVQWKRCGLNYRYGKATSEAGAAACQSWGALRFAPPGLYEKQRLGGLAKPGRQAGDGTIGLPPRPCSHLLLGTLQGAGQSGTLVPPPCSSRTMGPRGGRSWRLVVKVVVVAHRLEGHVDHGDQERPAVAAPASWLELLRDGGRARLEKRICHGAERVRMAEGHGPRKRDAMVLVLWLVACRDPRGVNRRRQRRC